MLIKKVHIEKFRGFHDQEFEVGSMLTAIAGQNGTQKSTLLGMITQTFLHDLSEADEPVVPLENNKILAELNELVFNCLNLFSTSG